MLEKLTNRNFKARCDELAQRDPDLKYIILLNGYPPFWSRRPGFATLIHILLEQQVSLASAKAAFDKLVHRIGTVTPSRLAALSDEEMKACYFSRQKVIYARHLASTIISGQLNLKQLESKDDAFTRDALQKIKGIGEWTVDVYLMMALHRPDYFPLGDIALLNSLKEVKYLAADTSKHELSVIANTWKPYRTVAAFLLWHAYLCKRKAKGGH
ncbi:MAG: DNA-3-methyladenine glycosylase 2 family protein [Chitinophagaceae bacterium]